MRKRLFAGFAASVLAAGIMAAVPMTAGADVSITAQPDTSKFEFEKYLIMNIDATTPNISFDYKIEPVAAAPEGISAGLGGAKFEGDDDTATVTFATTDETVLDDNVDKNKTISIDNETNNERIAIKALTVDLSDVAFTEPGTYRYQITETTANGTPVVYDTNNVKYLDVIVVNANVLDPNELKIETVILHNSNTASIAKEDKVTGFNNKYITHDLSLDKKITGNQASKSKYFKFTVKLSNPSGFTPNSNDSFRITGNHDPSVTIGENTYQNAATVTYSQLKTGLDFYLKGGQSLEINGLPDGVGYEITEDNEDYEPTITVSGDDEDVTANDEAAKVSDTALKSSTTVTFTNLKKGDIPTGVILAVAVPAALSLVGFIGMVTILIKRRKDNSEG
ncbi:MAG: hypothetical protein IJ555_14900 [Ruminococcus sp.]|nr:hypothetical protein [Ruminococcus sp.]